jgi:predicted ATPase
MPDPFLEIVKAVATVITAGIAYFALENWQRQDKAKREAEFLDALVDTTHKYIVEMHRPISLVEIAEDAMSAHADFDPHSSK